MLFPTDVIALAVNTAGKSGVAEAVGSKWSDAGRRKEKGTPSLSEPACLYS